MRLIFCCLVFLLVALTARADSTYSSQIHDLDYGSKMNEEPLVFLSNGQVLKLSFSKVHLLELLQKAKLNRLWLKITLNDLREITDLEITSPPFINNSSGQKAFNHFVPFTPSVLPSAEYAQNFFQTSRIITKESQCYNRAHVWAYDWRRENNLYSSKTWIFFTRKYIRKYEFDWWFHVAPSVHVVIDGKVRERIMDIKYSHSPMPLKQWTNIFMKDDADCPVVSKYSDYANYPESGTCFVMKSSMYYYQPLDLETLENKGIERTMWDTNELKQAYQDIQEETEAEGEERL